MAPGSTRGKVAARLFLPWRCALCGGRAPDGRDLCEPCNDGLPRVAQCCPRCGLTLRKLDLAGLCRRCAVHPPRFHRTVTPLAYDYPVDRLLLGLKFGRRIHLARALAHAIAERVRSDIANGLLDMPDALTPVPLHPRRLAERGFNQAEEIARFVGRELGLPVASGVCRRVRHTRMQSRLSDDERISNVAGAFECIDSPLQPAIVDDVVTTGATANAVAGALVGVGAEKVQVWAVARAA